MKSASTRALIALVVGGVLTLAAFIGTFFWAGVSQRGDVVRTIERGDTVWYTGPFEHKADASRYLRSYIDFPAEVRTGDDEVLKGTIAEVGDTDAGENNFTIDVGGQQRTFEDGEFEEVTVRGFEYGHPDWGQKIFYFHVPVAEISFIAFAFAAFYSVRFIMTRRREYDTRARIAMETTLVFILMTMATGILWTRAAWGVWWEWEPRLTTYFIMTLLVIAYFVLRNAVEDEERRALYAAAFSILGFIDAPISFFITRLIPSSHPVIERGGLEPPMLVTFIVAQVGMLLLGYAVYRLRMGEVELQDRLERAKSLLEG